MLKKLLEILKADGNLIDISESKALSMLKTSKEMFNLVFEAMEQNSDQVKAGVGKIDKVLNEKQKEVRRMVYEHLAISGAKDLMKSIQLFSIVNNIERIGDYAKNLAEVLDYVTDDFNPSSEYSESFDMLISETRELFDKTISVLDSKIADDHSATEVQVKGVSISSRCNSLIESIIQSSGECVKKSNVRLLLMVRYIKRINAHLKNIVMTLKDPVNSLNEE